MADIDYRIQDLATRVALGVPAMSSEEISGCAQCRETAIKSAGRLAHTLTVKKVSAHKPILDIEDVRWNHQGYSKFTIGFSQFLIRSHMRHNDGIDMDCREH